MKTRIRQVSSMSNHNSDRASWDPNNLVLDDVAPPKASNRKGRRVSSVQGRFIAGPIDIFWLSEARKLGVTALWVGLGLWFLKGLRHSDSLPIHAASRPARGRPKRGWSLREIIFSLAEIGLAGLIELAFVTYERYRCALQAQ
jgi:hypothetical protein